MAIINPLFSYPRLVMLPSLAIAAALIIYWALITRYIFNERARQRKGRHPMPTDFKLLRSPGEYLQEQILRVSDEVENHIYLTFLMPPALAVVSLILLPLIPARLQWWLAALALIPFFVSVRLRSRDLLSLLEERRCYRLGLLGERAVAEQLEAFRAEGFHVFQDVPATGSTRKFNLDHVLVGPAGVFVIETKARQKANPSPQDDDQIVTVDHSVLHWASLGDDHESIPQASNNAKWLRDFIKEKLNIVVTPIPVVVIPGWFIKPPPWEDQGGTAVSNLKQLEGVIKGPRVLEDRAVDLIRRRLLDECRTVPFAV